MVTFPTHTLVVMSTIHQVAARSEGKNESHFILILQKLILEFSLLISGKIQPQKPLKGR